MSSRAAVPKPVGVTTITNQLRSQFLLDPNVVYLNHGSAGACPQLVFEVYQRWQLEMERQPTDFYGRRAKGLLQEARASLGAYLHTDPRNLIFVTNSTAGANIIARSLTLGADDEVLATDHEYGSMDRMWAFICQKTGARYVRQPLPIPITSTEEILSTFWEAVTPHTRVIFMSHITSPSALILPVAEVCRRAREAGILTIIDGAHAPGQLPVDLDALGADFYVGNCHKWLCAPKGSAFLYTRPERQDLIEPLIVSWEWEDESIFVRRTQWEGTRDLAAFLSVPDAIEFQQVHNWDTVRAECHVLASETLQRLTDWSGLTPLAPNTPEWFAQMVTVPLPAYNDDLRAQLYAEYRIEVPILAWHDLNLMRVSVQGYNTREDLDCLVNALTELIPR